MSAAPEQALAPRRPLTWWVALVCAVAAITYGAWCFSEQVGRGFIATGLGNVGYGGASWGIYIAFDEFFVGVSFAGIAVSAMAHLFHIEALRPATRVAEVLAITALVAAGCAVVADLGRPLHGLLGLPRYARPQSPFFGTFTLVVAGYLFSILVMFFLSSRHDAAYMADSGPRRLRWLYRLWATGYRGTRAERRRHSIATFWLSIAIVPLLVIAHSTLGFVFGIQSGRPGWYGALQAPAFVVLAGVSGTGMVIIALASVRKIFGLAEQIPTTTFRWLGNFMATLALIYLYLMVVEELTATYAAPAADRRVAHEVVGGHFAPLFWTTVVCLGLTFAIPFVLRLRKMISIGAMVFVAVLANVAVVLKRLLLVVPSQTHGSLMSMQEGTYSPSHIEYGIIIGLFGLLTAAVLVFGRLFPLTPLAAQVGDPEASGADTAPRRLLRYAATGAVAAAALGLIALGLADSFRVFSGTELDPKIPYSPVLFAGGVMLLFSSAVIYETFPPARKVAADRDD